jgi:uncharacterized protein (TIGR02246 family)
MKHIFFVTMMLVVTCCLAFGQTTYNKTSRSGSDEQAVRQILDEAVAAAGRNDAEALDRLWASDYTFVNSSGVLMTKAQRLAALRSGDTKYESITRHEVNIRLYGNTAVVTGWATVKGRSRGQDISGPSRNTTVLVKQNGRWQIVAQHLTRITQP